MRPLIGAVIFVKLRFSLAFSMAAWSASMPPLILTHLGCLRIELLLGDYLRLPEFLIARQVHLGVAQLRLVARQLSLRLVHHRLERARIDLHQHLALV